MRTAGLAVCLLGLSIGAVADEIILTNGDRLTGQVERLAAGALTFKSAIVGSVTVPVASLKSLSTDTPVALVMDGKMVIARIEKSADGKFAILQGGQRSEFAFASLQLINPPPKPTYPIKGNAGAALSIFQANQNNRSFNVTLGLRRERPDDRFSFDSAYLSARQGRTTTEDAIFANTDYNFGLRRSVYGYVNNRLRKDRVQNLDLRTILGGGVGTQLVKGPLFALRAETGFTWLKESFSNGPGRSNTTGQFAYFLDWQIRPGTRFRHDFSYYPSLNNFSDYYFLTQFILEQTLAGSLYFDARMILDYDATPAPNTVRSTSKYLLGIGKRF